MVILRFRKVPHAFQQRLSYEKTPTLCDALPAFKAMIRIWKDHMYNHPETTTIIHQGIQKLETYESYAEEIPAYVLAMSVYSISCHPYGFYDSYW